MKYDGMTVNERLFVSGFLDDYEEAVANGNVRTAVEILKRVELPADAISANLRLDGLDWDGEDEGVK